MLTVADFRLFASTPMGDAAIQKLLDDAYTSILERVGRLGVATSYLNGGGEFLVLPTRADPDEEVVVTEWYGTSSPTDLAVDDYQLGADGVSLRRKNDGTNPAYLWPATLNRVVFTRRDDTAKRDIVQRDLVKLSLDYEPLISQESIDGYAYSKASNSLRSYEDEYEAILARLDPPDVGFR